MNTKRVIWQMVLAAACALISAFQVHAETLFKANNTLPLNDPLSWDGGVVPGPEDIAVFDERVTTNTITSFVLTNNLSWSGMVFTNSVAPTNVMIGTVVLMTNGIDMATLTLGSNGVCLAGSGYALALNTPLALSEAQTWQLDRRNLTFITTVSGSVPWVLDMPSQTVWSVASGYSGPLTLTNTTSVIRFDKAGQWAKSLMLRGGGSSRWEMRFTTPIRWSELFLDKTATVNFWSGLTSGGTLQFDDGDVYQFPGGRFTLDSGTVVQNGGALSGYEVQCQYSTYNGIYVMNGGTLDLSSGLLLGNGLASAANEARFQLKGGTLSANSVKIGWNGCKYWGVNTFEVTGGVFRVTGARNADSGVHLSWSDMTNAYENSGLFLMRSGLAEVDQVSLGRSEAAAGYATTNALSMFKMSGGEVVLGSRGFYAGRTWNKGPIAGSAYAYKLSGGTLTAGDSWTSTLDLLLSDENGGTVFNTADTNGVGQRVVLNGAVYGPGKLTKVGAGTLVLAGEAAYGGKTTIQAGTLAVGNTLSTLGAYRWTADSVNDTNNALVATWTDLTAGVPATNTVASQAPRLISNELNGHSVLRFNSGANQYLAIEAAKSPMSGASNASIVVVFKTSSSGTGSAGYWYQNTGLIDAEQGGIQNDWGIGYNASGQVCGGIGYPSTNKDWTVYSSSAYSVANNQPHVAIFTWQGTNLTMNVDGRITTVIATSPVVSPRNTYRMLFGSMNLLGGYYFNGDIAEIRIYRNRMLTVREQNQVGSALSAWYGVPGAVFEEVISAPVSGEIAGVESSTVALPYAATVWDADTLTGTNNSAVTAWISTNGLLSATVAGVGKSVTAPTLLTGAINGHHAVRFTGSLMTGLGIPATQSPVKGSTNFTVAFVLRTTTPGKTTNQWYSSMGIIDAEQPGSAHDWGISFTGEGRIAPGIGNADLTVFSKLYDLHDGVPHVVVVSYDMIQGNIWIMTDGLCSAQSVGAHLNPRNAYRIVFGSLDALSGQFFTGDLAAVRFLPERALTEMEMTTLSQEMGAKYGVRLISRGQVLSPSATGLGRGDVEVYSGATLLLPAATNGAVTLVSGQTISGGGAVQGTLALDSGAVLDIGASEVLALDTLWLNNGAVLRWNHVSGLGKTVPVTTLKTGAAATLCVIGGSTLPERVAFLQYTSATHVETTVWTVSGGKPNSHVVVNAAAKTLDLVTPRGTMLLVR